MFVSVFTVSNKYSLSKKKIKSYIFTFLHFFTIVQFTAFFSLLLCGKIASNIDRLLMDFVKFTRLLHVIVE